jgi:arylsulfatase A
LPTLCDLADIEYKSHNTIDGLSLKPLLLKENHIWPDRALFMQWGGNNRRVRTQKYLMVNTALYDLESDPHQKYNIVKDNLKLYDSLNTEYQIWESQLPSTENLSNAIPVGYKEYPLTELPAHEANLKPEMPFGINRVHTGISYSKVWGWANDYITGWNNVDAYPEWVIDVQTDAEYNVYLEYSCEMGNVGSDILITSGGQSIEVRIDSAYNGEFIHNFDLIKRDVSALERRWNIIKVGRLKLSRGIQPLVIKPKTIAGRQLMDLKSIKLELIQ